VSPEFSADYAKEQLRRSRHPLRRVVKNFYLRNILRHVTGASIDFGCGAGQLLARLPPGSIGLEINSFLVESLRKKGLNVVRYDPQDDGFSLANLAENRYSTFIMAHVLEHFAHASLVLRRLLSSCRRLGVQRVVLILPGWKGYLADATHKTFVDRRYLEREALLSCEGYALEHARYFPIDHRALGDYFVFHEMVAVFDRMR
jgi:2-polyprenyl-3-methyl-5-hydroxy-6-metoxy-1,4-benzoquinol methylase